MTFHIELILDGLSQICNKEQTLLDFKTLYFTGKYYSTIIQLEGQCISSK